LLALDGIEQEDLAKLVAEKGLTVRETERLVKKAQEQSPKPDTNDKTKKIDPDVQRLETSLSEQLGAAVKIDHNKQGKGKMVISFHDLAQLDGILSQIHKGED
jgi:ParB family chromosome partitioning protein